MNSMTVRMRELLLGLFLATLATVAHGSPVADIEGVQVQANASTASPSGDCQFSVKESALRQRLLEDPEQQRGTLECDPELMAYAERRARQMAETDSVSHLSPDGVGPNEMLRDMGFELPDYYVGGRANSIESILGGEGEPDRTWEMFLQSRAHRDHLLGREEMYRAQSRYGIAHVFDPNSAHRNYWVVVIVEPRDPNQRPMTCTPPPSVCIVH